MSMHHIRISSHYFLLVSTSRSLYRRFAPTPHHIDFPRQQRIVRNLSIAYFGFGWTLICVIGYYAYSRSSQGLVNPQVEVSSYIDQSTWLMVCVACIWDVSKWPLGLGKVSNARHRYHLTNVMGQTVCKFVDSMFFLSFLTHDFRPNSCVYDGLRGFHLGPNLLK